MPAPSALLPQQPDTQPPPRVCAVLFGVLILLAVACCLLYWKLTWRRTAAWCTALLWLDVALLMLLGADELGGRLAGCVEQC